MTAATDRPEVTDWPSAAIPALDEGSFGSRPAVVVAPRAARLAEIRVVVPTVRLGQDVTASERAVLAACLGRRTASRDPDELADAFAACGGACRVEDRPGYVLITAYAEPDRVGDALDLVREVLCEPAYASADVASATRTLAAQLRARAASDGALLDDAVHRLTFAGSALAELAAPDRVAAVNAERLHEVHAASLAADGSTVIVVGDVDGGRIRSRLDALPSAWTGPMAVPLGPATSSRTGILIIDRPGAVQASIGTVGPAPVRGDPDYPALAAAVRIVGGTATSRVSVRLRERRGWAYFANVFYRHHPGRSAVVASTAVASEYAAAAVNELHYELARAATTTMGEEELRQAVRGLAGRQAVEVHTAVGLADELAALAAEGVSPAIAASLIQRLELITAGDVRTAAARYLAAIRQCTVVVGDAGRLADQLAVLGPVTVTDPAALN